MNRRRLIDTNLIIRHLVQDHASHAAAAAKLFEACDLGRLTLVLLPVVVAECVFVLESFYQHGRSQITDVLTRLIESPGISLADLAVHTDALKRYGNSRLHFVDCVIAATAAASSIAVATFDKDFRKFPDVRVQVE